MFNQKSYFQYYFAICKAIKIHENIFPLVLRQLYVYFTDKFKVLSHLLPVYFGELGNLSIDNIEDTQYRIIWSTLYIAQLLYAVCNRIKKALIPSTSLIKSWCQCLSWMKFTIYSLVVEMQFYNLLSTLSKREF